MERASVRFAAADGRWELRWVLFGCCWGAACATTLRLHCCLRDAWVTLKCWLGAAWVLLGCCLGAA
eukprot:10490578-Lingulodinium_polyedra.AAC.1